MELHIKRPNCEACIHEALCMHKADASLLWDDIKKMVHWKGQTYAELVTPFQVNLTCEHFINWKTLKEAQDSNNAAN